MLTRKMLPPILAVLSALALALPAAADTPISIQNGTIVTDLAGGLGTKRMFRINVPSGAAFLDVASAEGRGDCDLYIRFGQPATPEAHDFRGIGTTTAERIKIDRPKAGWWYILVFGAGDYAGAKLRAQFPAVGGSVRITPLVNNVVQYGLAGHGPEDFDLGRQRGLRPVR